MALFALTFLKDRRGATAIEYALIAALLGMVVAAAATTVGSALWTKFADVANNTG
jgi:pilus assembly protein Flp/PilA